MHVRPTKWAYTLHFGILYNLQQIKVMPNAALVGGTRTYLSEINIGMVLDMSIGGRPACGAQQTYWNRRCQVLSRQTLDLLLLLSRANREHKGVLILQLYDNIRWSMIIGGITNECIKENLAGQVERLVRSWGPVPRPI